MKRPLVVGVDIATATGICTGQVGETPVIITKRFSTSAKDEHADIFGRAAYFWVDFLRLRTPDLIVIEAPINAKWGKTKADTTKLLLGLQGIFIGIAKAKNIAVRRVEVNVWRKYFLGVGNLHSAEAKSRAVKQCQLLDWKISDHNGAESAGCWLWGCAQIEPRYAHRPEPLFTQGRAA